MATLTMKMLQEQINELKKEVSALKDENKVRKFPEGLSIGDTFDLVNTTWKILDITDSGYLCLADDIGRMEFDEDSNNWVLSNLREYLNGEFFKKIADEVGEDNIIPFERNLMSLDGQREYGYCNDKISLLTVDEYRQYRELIPNTDDYWWWLITPWSTPCNDWETSVTVVSSSGSFFYGCCNGSNGVRPVCIFSSSIFESEE